jgi:hypothetical protein
VSSRSRRLVQSSYTDSAILPARRGHRRWTSQAYPVNPTPGNALVHLPPSYRLRVCDRRHGFGRRALAEGGGVRARQSHRNQHLLLDLSACSRGSHVPDRDLLECKSTIGMSAPRVCKPPSALGGEEREPTVLWRGSPTPDDWVPGSGRYRLCLSNRRLRPTPRPRITPMEASDVGHHGGQCTDDVGHPGWRCHGSVVGERRGGRARHLARGARPTRSGPSAISIGLRNTGPWSPSRDPTMGPLSGQQCHWL